jgi:hypothetical protein
MYFKESNNFLTKENISFIKETILKDNFPYYRAPDCTVGDKTSFLYHCLLKRPEERQNKEDINSNYYLSCLELVESFFKKTKIKHKEILRMSVNFTFNNGVEKCPTHQDHKYPHKQLIIYLNDADPLSKTVMLDKKNKPWKEITPEKYKGICFDNLNHYHFYPKSFQRLVPR